MQPAAKTNYPTLTLGDLRASLTKPLSKIGLQLKGVVLENLSIDPNSNLRPWQNGNRWIVASDPSGHKARVCVSGSVWQRAQDKGFKITKDAAIDVAVNGLSMDKWMQLQIDALAIRVSGQSKLEAKRESIVRYCEQNGYFVRNKKAMPIIIRKVAIITTENSSIESDITRQICIKDSFMDAHRFNGKPDDLARWVKRLSLLAEHDIICLYRGGREDESMFVFSDPCVLDAIVQSYIPVVTALGHERDVPPVQMVADMGFASPTKFATYVRNKNDTALKQARQYLDQIHTHFDRYLSTLEKSTLVSMGNIDRIASSLSQAHGAKQNRKHIIVTILMAVFILALVVAFFMARGI